MEAAGTVPAEDSVPERTRARLLREPLFWAAVAAFSGTVLGLFGTARQASLGHSFYVVSSAQVWLAQIPGFLGEALVMSSSLGAVYLGWGAFRKTGRRLTLLGVALLALLLMAEAVGVVVSIYWSTGERWQGYAIFPFPALENAAYFTLSFFPPVLLSLFAACAFVARERGLGGLLSCLFLLSLPLWELRLLFFPPDTATLMEPSADPVASLLGYYSVGISLLEGPLWVLFGLLLLRRARDQTFGEAFRVREENLVAARRLYEDGLGRGDASVVDDLVTEDFRDLKRGSRGKLGMERVFSALRKSYPDLEVSIENQEAEDDLVRTRLVLSGTDRGGVLWYPPTGRHATFTADFVDRFSGGRLVEHSGEADTEDLLRQLGVPEDSSRPHRDAGA